ncbi:hypothetical protein [Cupriavidus basilensis]
MSLNELPVQPASRQPRGIVKVAGVRVDAWIDWSVDNNTFYQADTFRVSFAVTALPAETNAAWFAAQKEAFVEIFAGFPGDPSNFSESDLQSLIYGRVDDIDYDPVATTLVLTGRDLTAAFIDAKTSMQYQNLTSSEIAIQLAQAHGLTPVVTATTTKAGSLYAYDHVRMVDQRSEWDLLTWLASEEGFICYVKGQELHFEPRQEDALPVVPVDKAALQKEFDEVSAAWRAEQEKAKALNKAALADSDAKDAAVAAGDDAAATAAQQAGLAKVAEATATLDRARGLYKRRYHDLNEQLRGISSAPVGGPSNVYELRWVVDDQGNPSANVRDLRLSRSLTVAKGVTVVVRSWHLKPSNRITAYYPSRGKTIQPGKASPFGNQQIYTFNRGGMDQDRANTFAQRMHREITQHEMKLRARLPADNVLTQTTLVRLTGTGTAFDQDYYVDGITRQMSLEDGYVMDISAKNHNPDSVPPL